MDTVAELKDSGQPSENMENVYDFSSSDFAKIVKTTPFVDKTLMIKEIFRESSKILITAPRQFGKSTNIDMVKKFCEIEVNMGGTKKAVHTTKNYSLFKDNNLEICKHEEFFNTHFGKYPVVYIDFEPLSEANGFVNMLDIFRTIVQKTYNEHSYLLDTPRFHEIKKNYFSEESAKDMCELDLMQSFEYLSKILCRHFDREVFVLIDDCDAFVNSSLFSKNNPDMNKMISFIKVTIGKLVNKNPSVGRALLTGVLPITNKGFPFDGNNIDCFYFMDNHRFCKYYGLNSEEFEKVVKKLIKSDEERNEAKIIIGDYYNGYSTETQTDQIYNIWSVLQYLRRRKVLSYWNRHEYAESLNVVFQNSYIEEELIHLLCGDELLLDTSCPLSVTDVLNWGDGKKDSQFLFPQRAFLLLYHFGYLAISRASGRGSVYLKIPNEEIKYEITTILSNKHICDPKNIDGVRCSIDSVRPDRTDRNEMFKIFGEAIKVWYNSLNPKTNILTNLLMILVTKPEYSRIAVRKFSPNDPMVILLKNNYQVAIFITEQEGSTNETAAQAAEKAIKNLFNANCEEQLCNEFNKVSSRVLFAIGSKYTTSYSKHRHRIESHSESEISIAYSYHFREGDNLQDYVTTNI